jgi:general secretion pathway protein B
MSYILDALRKAERDRNLGRTPSLGDVTTPVIRPPERRPTPRTLALIGLVVVLLIVTLWLWPRTPAPAPAPTGAPPDVVAGQPAVSATVSPPPAPAPEIPAPAPSPAAVADGTVDPDVPADSIDDLMDDSEAAAGPSDELASGIEEAAPAPRRPGDSPAVSQPSSPREDSAAPPPAPEPAAASEIPLLRDMPADYRGAFPELRVDVHVYDEDAARRWVLVNGHKAVEGTTLAEGPTVSHITPEGIVFDFHGRSVLFPLNR